MRSAPLLLALLMACAGGAAAAHTHRSHTEKAAFQREHPCPSTGQHRGSCPGYVIDHVRPLCAGGADARSNMAWQSVAEAKAKDKLEWQECRALRRSGG